MATSGGLLVRDCGESCRFTRFHRDPAEVDRSLEIVLDDRFQQVSGTHGCPTSRQDQICGIETLLDLGNMILDTRQREKWMRNVSESSQNKLTRTCRGRCIGPLHDTQDLQGQSVTRGDWYPKFYPKAQLKSFDHHASQRFHFRCSGLPPRVCE